MGADTVKDDAIRMSIDKAMEDGAADDGMPVKLAKHVEPGDVVILDWPAWVLAEVMFVHHETSEGSGVHTVRWQIAPLVEKEDVEIAFVMRGAHEYVRVQSA